MYDDGEARERGDEEIHSEDVRRKFRGNASVLVDCPNPVFDSNTFRRQQTVIIFQFILPL